MILQSENPIRMVRELAGTPITLIFALMCVKQRVSQAWLESTTGFSDKTVSKGLAYLREAQLVDWTSAGWQLVKENVKQLPLVMEIEEETEEQIVTGEDHDLRTPSKYSGGHDDNMESRRNSDSVNYLSTVVVVNDLNINNTSTTDLNLTEKSGKIPTLEEIQRVLDAAEELLGNRILGEPWDYADIDRLLSWIAKAYDGYRKSSKSKVYNPAGLVFWAFHKGREVMIEKRYLDLNRVELPESFCRASGQWEFEEEEV